MVHANSWLSTATIAGHPQPGLLEDDAVMDYLGSVPELDPEVEMLVGQTTTAEKTPKWKRHMGHGLDARVFAVEWKDSTILDSANILRALFGLIGKEIAFVLGTDVVGETADYLLLLRADQRQRWRDWRTSLGFGIGEEGENHSPRIRIWVPADPQRVEGIAGFVKEMGSRCEAYPRVIRFREKELNRTQVKKNQFSK